MTKLFTSLFLISILFTAASYGQNSTDKKVQNSLRSGYTDQDATTAINSFNQQLLDPVRKLYYRDSDKPEKLGAIWTQAVYWDMIMNTYKRTQDPAYLQMVEDIYQGGYNQYDHYNWDNKIIWFIYDDIMWWVISMARAYEMTGEQKYLDLSESGFKRIWSGSTVVGDVGSYDPVNSGMFWMFQYPDKPDAGKMSCINYPTVVAAMALYKATNKVDYLNKAKEIYTWSRTNLFDAESGRVADSKHGTGTPNWKAHTYNQATCIGAAVMLYKETNEQNYLADAVLAADYTKNSMCDANGILPYELGEEQGVYTAIFAQYIIRLIEDCNKPEYLPWLRLNINTAWQNRDTARNLTTKNYMMPAPQSAAISCYDASGIPALMQVCPVGESDPPVPAPVPVQITDAAGLRAMANNLRGYYQLANDITLTEDWVPVGSDNSPFAGFFDGNGKIIKDLKINQPNSDRLGLFGTVEVATIKRLGLENVSVTGRNDVGAVAGRVRATIIDQCYVTGSVEGNDHVGSIVGGAESGSGQSTLMNCYAYASSSTRSTQVGGLLGTTKDLTLKNSYFAGIVISPNSNSGGIVSLIDGGSSNVVENCVSMASNIKGSTVYRILANDGGRGNITTLINNFGYDQSLINGNTVTLTSSNLGPDLKHGANKTLAELQNQVFYVDSLNWDTVSVWKISPQAFPIFKNQSLPMDLDQIALFPQSLILPEGHTYQLNSASVIPNTKVTYVVSDASKVKIDNNGLITAIKGGSVTIMAHTDTTAFSLGKKKICNIEVKTIKTTLSTPEDLDNMRYQLDGTFTLANDIDMSGYENFVPVGADMSAPFVGKLDGKGFIIKNLNINRPEASVQGLFGYLKNAEIKELGLTDINIIGKNDVGGLAGISVGTTVEQVCVTGYVEGNDHVGGIFGATTTADGVSALTSITNAYVNAHVVTRSSQVGGILGVAKSATIKNVYVAGRIEALPLTSQGANAGGIVSLNEDNKVSIEAVAVIPEFIKGGTPNYFVCRDNDFQSASLPYSRNDMPAFAYATADHGKEGYLIDNNLLDHATFLTQEFYQTTLGWDFTNVWKMSNGGYPVFKNMSTTAIEDITINSPAVNAYSSNGSIIITTEAMANVSVYDISGRKVHSMKLEGTSNPIPLKAGVYLIRADRQGVSNVVKVLNK